MQVEARRLVAGVERRDPAAEAVADDPPGDVGDALGGEAELLEDRRRPGADAPKWSSPTIAPSSPTQRSQPSETPTSTLTPLPDRGGRTASR